MPRVRKLVPISIIFAVKRITISEISKKVLNNILAECDRTSPIKNFTG